MKRSNRVVRRHHILPIVLCGLLPAATPLAALAATQPNPPAAAATPAPTSAPTDAAPAGEGGSGTGRSHRLRDRFAAADTDHDGHLTLAEAQAAGMKGVVRRFDAIDATHKGYVTLDDLRAFHGRNKQAAGGGQ